VFAQTGVLLSAGSGFGTYARGCCRTSLVVDDAGIRRVLELLGKADIDWR
jgi:aspartate/methionine/tyrosine aminotransferase